MPKVTIYTQAYNTEKYIGKCIESVLSQTFADFEYILVDNGSADGTWDIIAQYAGKDNRIKTVRFEDNRSGFWPELIKEMAQGAYLTMLDSDDWIEPDYVETLLALTEKQNLDIAVIGSFFHYIDSGKIAYRKSNLELILNKSQIPAYFSFLYQFFRTVWGKLYKTSIFRNADYSDYYTIVKSAEYGADTVFCLEMLKGAERIGVSDKILHHYLVHSSSVSYKYNPKRFVSDTFLFHKGERILSGFGAISRENYQFLYIVYINAVIDTINVITGCALFVSEKLSEANKILADPLTQKALTQVPPDTRQKTFRENILKLFVKTGNENPDDGPLLDLIYSNICSINKDLALYVNSKNLPQHLSNAGFLFSAINVNPDEMLKAAIASLENKSLSKTLWTALKGFLKKNAYLQFINEKCFVMHYPGLIADVCAGRNFVALNNMIKILASEKNIPFKEDLLILCLNISDELENKAIWIYAKKLLTQLYISRKRFADARTALDGLLKTCPNDEEVIKLSKWLVTENG